MVESSLERCWQVWTLPEYIVDWNFASEDWACRKADNNLVKGGKFSYRMGAKDGSMGFDFSGHHSEIEFQSRILSVLDDGRKLEVYFNKRGKYTHVLERFDPDPNAEEELQKQGWQAILNNYKKLAESLPS